MLAGHLSIWVVVVLFSERVNAMGKKNKQRVWVIVGASRNGIGTAIAEDAANAGEKVIITGLDETPLSLPHGDVAYHRLDICNNAELEAFSKQVKHIDVLVNCAGISRRYEEDDIDVFKKVIEINLTGNFAVIRKFEDRLISAKGVIINIASMYSFFGSPKIPAYGASKAAIQQLTKSLAIRLAPQGVRVNAIAPGFIVTEQTSKGRADKAHYEAVKSRTPYGRWGEPHDVSGVAMFLASEQAKFVTGQTIAVDGGYTIV